MVVSPLPTAETKQRLLQSAQALFAEKGFAATTIRELADHANVNVAAINYHFGDKERLYIEAVKHAHRMTCQPDSFPEIPDDLPPVEQFRHFVREMTLRMTSDATPMALQLVMRELSHPTEAAREIVRENIQPMAFRLRDIVRNLLPGASESTGLMVGFSVIGQILFYRQNRPVSELIFGKEQVDQLSQEQIADHVTHFSLAALGFASPVTGDAS